MKHLFSIKVMIKEIDDQATNGVQVKGALEATFEDIDRDLNSLALQQLAKLEKWLKAILPEDGRGGGSNLIVMPGGRKEEEEKR